MTDSNASDRVFEARRAESDADRERALQVRFEAYCLEARFFDPELFPDGQERDVYDERALQSLLIFLPTQTAVGTARLILPASDQDVVGHFPFDEVCDSSPLYRDKVLPPGSTAEISRFCMTERLLREIKRCGRKQAVDRLRAQAKLVLMRSIIEMTTVAEVTHWCAVMDPALLQSFERLGVRFTRFGPPVRYHGERQPCYGEVQEILHRVRRDRFDIWSAITDEGRLCR